MIEPDALARALADAYRLRVTGLSPLEGGSLNAGYRVEATDGDFHVKCYDGRIYQADAVRRSLAAREYVGRSGVPVPAVRLNIDGDAITDVPRVGSVVLSAFIAGRHHQRGSIPDRAAGAMGRMLGRLHHILARFGEPRPYAAPSCTGAWPITARYEHPDAYQPRWDRFIGEPSDWWEEHAGELTERLLSLCHREATTEP